MERRSLLALGSLTLFAACLPKRSSAKDNKDKPTIALFGATARSGREIIKQAISRGHKVKGFARTPSKLGFAHKNLQMFKGDIKDPSTIQPVLSGNEVVLSMIGYGAPADPMAEIGPVDIYTKMGTNLIAAMRAKGNQRLIIASSTGVEQRVDVMSPKPSLNNIADGWKWNARHLYNDMYEMEKMVEKSGLEYIILRPGFMVEEPARRDIKYNTTGDTPSARIITYEDFASYILDNLDTAEHLNMAVGLYSDTVMNPEAEIERYLAEKESVKATPSP